MEKGKGFIFNKENIARPYRIIGVITLAGLLVILYGFLFPKELSVCSERKSQSVVVYNSIIGEVTAYNAVSDQTDDTPNIAADGYPVAKGMAACPSWLSFGTRIQVNGNEYVCRDRMALRYRHGNYFDILMEDHHDAHNFGRQKIVIVIK